MAADSYACGSTPSVLLHNNSDIDNRLNFQTITLDTFAPPTWLQIADRLGQPKI